MNKENAIFLGAGASAPEGAPLQAELFSEYFRHRTEYPPDIREGIDSRLALFFEHLFGIDVDSRDLDAAAFPTFEEAMGMVELSINRLECFRGYGEDPWMQTVQVWQDLVFLIAIIMNEKLGAECRYHTELVSNLAEQGKLAVTSFVDLNYDTLMFNALLRLAPDFGPGFGVRFTNPSELPESEECIPLYKVHGSLNWLYCPTCISMTLTPVERGTARLVFEPARCGSCGTMIIPIINPPSFMRVLTNHYLETVWREAEETLLEAKRIFFCGYSFPEADIHIKYMLKRVEVNTANTPEIVVINNFEGKPQGLKDIEKSRYRRFFKDTGRVDYREQTFQEFARQGIPD